MAGTQKVYFQEEIRDIGECTLSVMDHGPRYGCGAFETFRLSRQQRHTPGWEDRYLRLKTGIGWLGIDPTTLPLWSRLNSWDASPLLNIGVQLQEANGLEDALLRYTIYPGPSRDGLADLSYERPIEMIDLRPAPPLPPRPRNLYLLDTVQAVELPPFKSTSYLTALRGLRELRQQSLPNLSEGLLVTRAGHLAEGLFSNLFAILKDGALWTPPNDGHILVGITRERVLTTAAQLGIPVHLSREFPDFLRNVQGLFTTNSGSGLTPIHTLYHKQDQILWSGEIAQNELWKVLSDAVLPINPSDCL